MRDFAYFSSSLESRNLHDICSAFRFSQLYKPVLMIVSPNKLSRPHPCRRNPSPRTRGPPSLKAEAPIHERSPIHESTANVFPEARVGFRSSTFTHTPSPLHNGLSDASCLKIEYGPVVAALATGVERFDAWNMRGSFFFFSVFNVVT